MNGESAATHCPKNNKAATAMDQKWSRRFNLYPENNGLWLVEKDFSKTLASGMGWATLNLPLKTVLRFSCRKTVRGLANQLCARQPVFIWQFPR
jgi:hypothetical protein